MSESMDDAAQKLMHLCKEVSEFARSSVDANVKSVAAAAKGWEEGSQSVGHLFHENIERLMNVGKNASSAKSVEDVVAMQRDFMKDCLELWMAGATKLSEISSRTAKDVVGPVAQNANEAISRIMQKTGNAA